MNRKPSTSGKINTRPTAPALGNPSPQVPAPATAQGARKHKNTDNDKTTEGVTTSLDNNGIAKAAGPDAPDDKRRKTSTAKGKGKLVTLGDVIIIDHDEPKVAAIAPAEDTPSITETPNLPPIIPPPTAAIAEEPMTLPDLRPSTSTPMVASNSYYEVIPMIPVPVHPMRGHATPARPGGYPHESPYYFQPLMSFFGSAVPVFNPNQCSQGTVQMTQQMMPNMYFNMQGQPVAMPPFPLMIPEFRPLMPQRQGGSCSPPRERVPEKQPPLEVVAEQPLEVMAEQPPSDQLMEERPPIDQEDLMMPQVPPSSSESTNDHVLPLERPSSSQDMGATVEVKQEPNSDADSDSEAQAMMSQLPIVPKLEVIEFEQEIEEFTDATTTQQHLTLLDSYNGSYYEDDTIEIENAVIPAAATVDEEISSTRSPIFSGYDNPDDDEFNGEDEGA